MSGKAISEATQQAAILAISRGLTPSRLEDYYATNGTREGCQKYYMGQADWTALAKRWGIGRR